MPINISRSEAQDQILRPSYTILTLEGTRKNRISLVSDSKRHGGIDTRFSIAAERANEIGVLKKIIFEFTHVKTTIDQEVIYINKRSASTRLGISIDKVKHIARHNGIETSAIPAEQFSLGN